MAEPQIAPTKKCSKCGAVKPRTPEYFHFCNGYPRPRCKPCWREWEREYFWTNREAKRHAAQRRWAKADKETARKAVRAWKEANPEKAKQLDQRRTDRIKASPKLKAEVAAKTRRWRAANAVKVREDRRRNYAANRDRHLAYQRDWRERNSESVRAKERAYRAAHPEKGIADAEMRRARMLAAEGEFTGHDVIALIRTHGRICFYCQAKLKKYQVDHFIPLSRGGTNWPDNLVISCGTCNRRKANKLPWEWQPHRFKEGHPPRT